MIFEDVFRQMLIDCNVTEQRVFLQRAPQKPAPPLKTPYIVFFHVGPEPMHTMMNPLLPMVRVYQISIFDPSQSRAIAICDTIRGKLDGWHGDYLGVRFGAILYDAETSAYEFDTELHHKIIHFRILYHWLDLMPAKFNPSSNNRSKDRSNAPCPRIPDPIPASSRPGPLKPPSSRPADSSSLPESESVR